MDPLLLGLLVVTSQVLRGAIRGYVLGGLFPAEGWD